MFHCVQRQRDDRNASDDYSDIERWPENTAEAVTLVRKSLTETVTKLLEYTGFDIKEKASNDSTTPEASYFPIYRKRHHAIEEFLATLVVVH